jgi:citrate lyase subunit beta/citryl-CoA lyase
VDVDDLAGMRVFAAEARAQGFEGVGCLHPRQVAAAHGGFQPRPDEVERARRILAAFDGASAAGRGAVSVDGRMVDAPVAERARRILRLAEVGP